MINKELINELEGRVVEVGINTFKNWLPDEYEGLFAEGFISHDVNWIQITFGCEGLAYNFGKTRQDVSNQDIPAFEEEYSSYPDKTLKNYLKLIN